MLIMQIVFSYLLSDFFSGLIHWWEDRYISANTPFWGKLIGQANEKHHKEPNHFLKFSYFNRISISAFVAFILGLIIWAFGFLSWQVMLILFILSQANQIHAWAHQGRTQNGRFISALQKTGILQSTKHHAWHHKAPHTTNYCAVTNWLNPLLNKFNFWHFLEKTIEKLFKISPINK